MIDDNMKDMTDKIRRSSSGVSLCEGELIMKLLLLLVAACLRSAFAGPSAACGENNWPLCDYVFREDGMWAYEKYNEEYDEEAAVTSHYFNMTSQRWKDESWTDWPVWWHHMVIHIPDAILYPNNGFVYVSYRSNDNSPPSSDTQHTYQTRQMASESGFITSVIYQIPNQPIVYTEDPDQSRRWEDDSIAWTWRYFLDSYEADPDTADPEVVLRMPMCKAVVRAMDTVQQYVNEELGLADIEDFMLAGESKRGWTTWMTAPIDDRVVAMAPVVLSNLNMQESFHHYYQSFGGWPLYFWDYWSKGLMGRIDDPAMDEMCKIVDPYSYIDGMTMPTFMVSSASDEFFLLDDTHYFFDDLPGDSFFWLLENSGHGIGSSPRNSDYWRMLGTFYLSVMNPDYTYPQLTWEREAPIDRDGVGTITVSADRAPTDVMAFSAPTVVDDRRDWRKSVRCDIGDGCGEKNTNITWAESPVEDLGDNTYSVSYEVPEVGFLAFYIQMLFEGPGGREFWVSTEANIVPDYFPYDDCTGRNCTGILK